MKISLSTKLFQIMIALVAVAVILFAGAGIFQVYRFAGIMGETNREQNAVIMDTMSGSMEEVAADSYRKYVVAEAKLLDEEFWTMRHDLEILAQQVQEILEHPARYTPVDVPRPSLENAGKLTVQLIYSDRADQTDRELNEQIGRVGTLGSTILKIVSGSDTLLDCMVSLPGGATVIVDRTPEAKIGPNGEYLPLNACRRPWYAGAATHGEPYFSPVNRDNYHNTYEVMAGVPVYVNGELAAVCGSSIQMNSLEGIVSDAQLGENSHTCLINETGSIIYSSWTDGELGMPDGGLKSLRESSNAELVALVNEALTGKTGFSLLLLNGEETYIAYAPLPTVGWAQLLTVSREELNQTALLLTRQTDEVMQESMEALRLNQIDTNIRTVLAALLLLALAALASRLFAKRLVRPIERMTQQVSEMQGDDVTFHVDDILRTGDEIEVLACSIEEMDAKLHRYILENSAMTAEKERISTELSLATRIQSDMMPSVFPKFTGAEEFSIDALMHPAKEVGGDFYDFFRIDDDHLALVTADVSGKGVGAALFMMISKTLLKNEAMHGKAPVEVLREVNAQLSESNKEGMFVTVWLGILDLSTLKLSYADAGHEKLLLCHEGKWRYIEKPRRSAALAMLPPDMLELMPTSPFAEGELQLSPGDALLQYTDGVTEATNAQSELFGEERLLDTLNRAPSNEPTELLPYLRGEIDAFVQDAEQFDDITLLGVRLKKQSNHTGTKTGEETQK